MSTATLSELVPAGNEAGLERVISLVLDGVTSAHTKTAYRRALRDFVGWYRATGQQALDKATVQRYASELAKAGASAASINQRLSAIRKLSAEAADNGLLPEAVASAISRVKGRRQEGRRSGNWLDKEQAQALLDAPDTRTLKGLRDRAILAVLLGCGLRRAEAARLTFDHIGQRDGRWVLVDLVGKGNKVRTVPMPSWAKAAIDAWAKAAGIAEGHVFRSVNRHGQITGQSMTDQAIADVVRAYRDRIGQPDLDAHDLRRTFAKLAHKGGAALEQIQLSLGHGSLVTTERYLGVEQDLTQAPCDMLGLRLAGK